MDEDLKKILAGFGIDATQIAAGTGGGVKTGPTVYFGGTTVESTGPLRQRDPKWKPDGKRKVMTQSDPKWKPTSFRNPKAKDDVKSLEEANAAFYAMDESELTTLQRRLIAAGILDPKTTALGQYDDDTYSAFSAINERTAKFNAVGKKFTPSDVLAMIERNPLPGSPAAVEVGNVITKTDKLSLEAQVQATARERLGRKLRKNEVTKFVSLYQGMEASYGAKLNAAEDRRAAGADVTVTEQASPDVAADQFIDSNFAQEAAGESAYDYLGALRNLIGG